ncbi:MULTISPECIES: hypothetical protein [unclassified Psychrobacter]|uniref:hypothetical protein n=1 Tax=unclassified Psychrobacter TaxID=196806 RepID=UPI003FB78140
MLSLKSIIATGIALTISTVALANEPNMHTEKDKTCCAKMDKDMNMKDPAMIKMMDKMKAMDDKCCEKNDSEQ